MIAKLGLFVAGVLTPYALLAFADFIAYLRSLRRPMATPWRNIEREVLTKWQAEDVQ